MQLYDKFSGKKTKPGMKKFMCLEELNSLASKGAIFGDAFGEK